MTIKNCYNYKDSAHTLHYDSTSQRYSDSQNRQYGLETYDAMYASPALSRTVARAVKRFHRHVFDQVSKFETYSIFKIVTYSWKFLSNSCLSSTSKYKKIYTVGNSI